jgi:hypothetical protein
MNDAPVAELMQNRFATAVRNFTPKLSAKFQKLLPFKDGITELRRKGASYETITDVLRNINVVVSHDTVTRFCDEVLRLTPAQRRRRKVPVRVLAQRPGEKSRKENARDNGKPQGKVDNQPAAGCERSIGPRIADPDTI